MTQGRLAFASYSSGWTFNLATKEAVTDQLGLKGASCDPGMCSAAGAVTAGQVFLYKFRAWGTSINAVVFNVATAVVGSTSTFVSIYKADGTQNADMATATVDANASVLATGMKTIALTNAVALTLGADYYVAMLVTGAPSTNLALTGVVAASAALSNANLAAATGFRAGSGGAGLAAMPVSVTLATMTARNLAFVGVQ